MIDHVGIGTDNLEKLKGFYMEALKPLGISVIMEFPEAVGLWSPMEPFFWLMKKPEKGGVHIAFSSKDQAGVDAFYQAALRAGGKDNGAPGIREHYSPDYYAAFILDPDGNNIEVVCHTSER